MYINGLCSCNRSHKFTAVVGSSAGSEDTWENTETLKSHHPYWSCRHKGFFSLLSSYNIVPSLCFCCSLGKNKQLPVDFHEMQSWFSCLGGYQRLMFRVTVRWRLWWESDCKSPYLNLSISEGSNKYTPLQIQHNNTTISRSDYADVWGVHINNIHEILMISANVHLIAFRWKMKLTFESAQYATV